MAIVTIAGNGTHGRQARPGDRGLGPRASRERATPVTVLVGPHPPGVISYRSTCKMAASPGAYGPRKEGFLV